MSTEHPAIDFWVYLAEQPAGANSNAHRWSPYITGSQQRLPPRLQRPLSGSAILKKPDMRLPL